MRSPRNTPAFATISAMPIQVMTAAAAQRIAARIARAVMAMPNVKGNAVRPSVKAIRLVRRVATGQQAPLVGYSAAVR